MSRKRIFLEKVWCQQNPGSQDELFFSFYLFSGYLSTVFSTKGNGIKFLPEFPGKKKKDKFYFCLLSEAKACKADLA